MLVDRVDIRGFVLECCVGNGDIARELQGSDGRPRHLVLTNDLDTKRPAEQHGDATDRHWWDEQTVNWVVTNPPFNVAPKIVPLAVEKAFNGVAMLLRLSYLEPCAGRMRWLAEHPPTKQIVLPRISFTGDGKTDSVTCAWFVWERGAVGQSIEIVPPTPDGQLSLLEATA